MFKKMPEYVIREKISVHSNPIISVFKNIFVDLIDFSWDPGKLKDENTRIIYFSNTRKLIMVKLSITTTIEEKNYMTPFLHIEDTRIKLEFMASDDRNLPMVYGIKYEPIEFIEHGPWEYSFNNGSEKIRKKELNQFEKWCLKTYVEFYKFVNIALEKQAVRRYQETGELDQWSEFLPQNAKDVFLF